MKTSEFESNAYKSGRVSRLLKPVFWLGRGAKAALRTLFYLPRFLHLSRGGRVSLWRVASGGKPDDSGRLPRYILLGAIMLAAIWAPVISYVRYAPLTFSSDMALILPGAGASTSINLSDIGQASSSANSAYSSSTLSPTVTYQSLLSSPQVLERAAEALGQESSAFGKPRIKLLDQTSFIQIALKGPSPEEARDRNKALLDAFLVELDTLRNDEILRRESSVVNAIDAYQAKVDDARKAIADLQHDSGLKSNEQYDAIIADNEDLQLEIASSEARLDELHERIGSLSRTLETTPEIAAIILKLRADPQYVTLADNLARDNAELARLAVNFGPKHPKIVGANNRVSGLRDRLSSRGVILAGFDTLELAGEVDALADGQRAGLLSSLVTLDAEARGLSAEIAAKQATLARGEARVRNLSDAAARLDALKREYKVAEAVFASALARINTAKSDIFASYPMVQVVSAPSIDYAPTSPNIKIAIAGGIAGSAFALFSLLLAWIRQPILGRAVRLFTEGS
ncbi:GumC family protein [Martelella radicis]|uniref:Uncharacterized protein involved in exopolysaccharide biosynthesis n=1 Tax=Martelella radicis TaxID=1397476 RepID=A0A7W6P8T1_9HYPH|nr:hypothetical protein [Martelella radicis]MBB4120626.1 uncharacterized protein involved in exopolysaccharide biosynthesis [Martelella radicis]